MSITIYNELDTIDSRDIIERIDELEGNRQVLQDAIDEAQIELDEFDDDTNILKGRAEHRQAKVDLYNAQDELKEWNDGSEADELAALDELNRQGAGISGWKSGVMLIRDSYFETYAREYAESIGAIDSDARWPCDCIDWQEAADELQSSFTSVDFDGETYWVNCA